MAQAYPSPQARNALTVATSDTVNLKDDATNNPTGEYTFGALYVGTGGDISVVMLDGNTKVFKNVPNGTFLPIAAKRVNTTGTVTAADMLWLVSR